MELATKLAYLLEDWKVTNVTSFSLLKKEREGSQKITSVNLHLFLVNWWKMLLKN